MSICCFLKSLIDVVFNRCGCHSPGDATLFCTTDENFLTEMCLEKSAKSHRCQVAIFDVNIVQ